MNDEIEVLLAYSSTLLSLSFIFYSPLMHTPLALILSTLSCGSYSSQKHFRQRSMHTTRQPPEMKELMSLASLLEKLRTNLEGEAQEWENAIRKMMKYELVMDTAHSRKPYSLESIHSLAYSLTHSLTPLECHFLTDRVLSVMQQGRFQLSIEYRHASLQQLKYLWSAIYGTTI